MRRHRPSGSASLWFHVQLGVATDSSSYTVFNWTDSLKKNYFVYRQYTLVYCYTKYFYQKMLLGAHFIYGFFFHNSGKLLSLLVLSSYSCRLIIFWLVSHWAASELVGVVIAFYGLYFVPPSLTLNLSYSIRNFAVYCTIHSLWAPLRTSCIFPRKHVNVSFSNKERQNIISKRKKKELETPTPPPQVRLQQRNRLINLSVEKQSKL